MKYLMLLVTMFLVISCTDKTVKKDDVQDVNNKKTVNTMSFGSSSFGSIEEMLPQNIEFYAKASSLTDMYKDFSINEKMIFGVENKEVNEITQELGFNPFSLSDLQTVGIDVNKKIGLVTSNLRLGEYGSPYFSTLFYIPVTGGEKLINKIKELVKKDNEAVQINEADNIISFVVDGITIYLTLRNEYLLFAFDPKEDAKGLISVTKDSSLKNNQKFMDLLSTVNKDEKIVVYGDLTKFLEQNAEKMKQEAYGNEEKAIIDIFKDITHFVSTLDSASKDLTVKSTLLLKNDSKYLNMFKNLKLNKKNISSINETPLFLLTTAVNVKDAFDLFLSAVSEYDAQSINDGINMLKMMAGIDVNEFIANLAGNINVATFNGDKINEKTFNTILTFDVVDSAKLSLFVSTLTAKIPAEYLKTEKINDVNVYKLSQDGMNVYFALTGNTFIMSTEKYLFEKALSKGSITEKITDKDLISDLQAEKHLFYIDITQLKTVLKNVNFYMSESEFKMMDLFKSLLISSSIDGNKVGVNFSLKTNFTDSFFVSLMKYFFAQQSQYDDYKEAETGGAAE